jgi:myo-inositol-1-phosphate synthase
MKENKEKPVKLGVMVVGLGGAVATTIVAGIELLKQKAIGLEGLPLAGLSAELLADYESLVLGGWDLSSDDLATAAAAHNVLNLRQFQLVAPVLEKIKPLPAVFDRAFCANISGANIVKAASHRAAVERLQKDLREFRANYGGASAVVINLASTEKFVEVDLPIFASLAAFEKGLDANAVEISPAMLYAYAAISENCAYANFTPSVAADIPALVEFAEKQNVPIAGKDGKTGQTMMKTVIAPGLKARALRVDGWYSTNILGNRDGLILDNPESLKSKIATKGSVLDDILGYRVEDHIVDIRYYRPRGDAKESWDNIDVTGFLGEKMQIKINFLCKDSILAAPLVIEIARLLDLAQRRGAKGIQEQLSVFFKLPQTKNKKNVHALHKQQQLLIKWLENQH